MFLVVLLLDTFDISLLIVSLSGALKCPTNFVTREGVHGSPEAHSRGLVVLKARAMVLSNHEPPQHHHYYSEYGCYLCMETVWTKVCTYSDALYHWVQAGQ